MDKIDVYEILVRQHEKMLNAYVVGLVRDPMLAEDVVQDAFVQAYRKLETLRNQAAFPAWLRAIARNLALAECRRRSREVLVEPEVIQGMEDVFARLDDPGRPAGTGGRGDAWSDRVSALRECFGRLPDKLREACTLHYMEDMPTKTIAQRLSLSLAGVLKRLERARAAIRQCVQHRLGLGDA